MIIDMLHKIVFLTDLLIFWDNVSYIVHLYVQNVYFPVYVCKGNLLVGDLSRKHTSQHKHLHDLNMLLILSAKVLNQMLVDSVNLHLGVRNARRYKETTSYVVLSVK